MRARSGLLLLCVGLVAACGTRTPGRDPRVIATVPANDAVGVSPTTAVAVTFDRAMLAASVTTNTIDDGCSGTLQLSFDDFATCVRMSAPAASNGGATFSAVPSLPLQQGAIYRLRVKGGVASAQGRILGQDFSQPDGFTVSVPASPTPTPGGPYSHTIAIDGLNDFSQVNERFTTTSSTTGYTGYVAWDASNLYLAMGGGDIGANDPKKWFVAYLGGAGGTTSGQLYNTQQPALPFAARWHLRWKTDGTLASIQTWNGTMWVESGIDLTGRIFKTVGGNYLEISLRRADLGITTSAPLVMGMINEAATFEYTYAGVPGDAFVDGYDRDYAHAFAFDLTASTPPNATPES